MKMARALSLVLVILVALSGIALAQDKGHQKNRPAPDNGGDIEWWGKAPGARNIANGTVANVSATSISVQNKEGVKSFAVNEKTVVAVHGQRATINDVKVNYPVMVKFQPVEGGVPVAIGINVPKPSASGKIVSIGGNVIVVATKTGQQFTVTTTPQTTYESHGYKATIADLRVGYIVNARGAQQGVDFVAEAVSFVPETAKGAVTAVNGNMVTVKTVKQAILQLQASDATRVLIRPRTAKNVKGTLADIKPGQPVDIGFHANPNGPAQLLWIDILTGE